MQLHAPARSLSKGPPSLLGRSRGQEQREKRLSGRAGGEGKGRKHSLKKVGRGGSGPTKRPETEADWRSGRSRMTSRKKRTPSRRNLEGQQSRER